MAIPRAQQQGWGHPADFRHKHIVAQTGHEVPDLPGAKFGWEKYDFPSVITQINEDSKLGMDAQDVQLLSMIYNALSEVRRFGADSRMDAHKGENPATHSLHSVIELDNVLARTNESPETCRDIRSTAGRALLIHDCGEILGEFNTLAQRTQSPHLQEDPAAERRILAHALRLAMDAIEHQNPEPFYTKIHDLRARAGIFRDGQPVGITKSKEDLDKLLSDAPPITDAAERRVQKWLALWDVCELKQDNLVKFTANDSFIGWLAKSVEHVQGTRHLLRMAERDSRHLKRTTDTLGMTNSAMVTSTLRYLEGELGSLFASAHSDLEQQIARTQAARTYETAREFLELVPPMVDPMPDPKIIRQEPEAAVVEERQARERDRGMARRIVSAMAKEDEVPLRTFKVRLGHAVLTMYKDAQARLLGLYEMAERAVAEGNFVPSVDAAGKGQVLALDPPPEFQLPLPERSVMRR